MDLGSTQPLTEKITRDISQGVNKAGARKLTNLPTLCAEYLEILVASNSWSPKGLSRPVMG
jgi:hypothetical protein